MEDVVAIGGFFFTVLALALGVPLVRSYVRRKEMQPMETPGSLRIEERLTRIEHAVEAIQLEVERVSEGQRFVTRLLAEREKVAAALPREVN